VASTALSYDLVRPWRRATLAIGALAAAELVVIGVIALPHSAASTPLLASHTSRVAASAGSAATAVRHAWPASSVRLRPRDAVRILVLNGTGRTGAAATAAADLHRIGYPIAGALNATHQNYAESLVMYKPGYRGEGLRLARELGVKIVGPLDGMSVRALHGGDLAVILGA
jgi:hypothetical protein